MKKYVDANTIHSDIASVLGMVQKVVGGEKFSITLRSLILSPCNAIPDCFLRLFTISVGHNDNIKHGTLNFITV